MSRNIPLFGNENEFLNLNHQLGDQLQKRSERQEIWPNTGYKPDLALKSKSNDRLKFIIEFESGTSRKHILGGLVKAWRWCNKKHETAKLLIVVKERGNQTTAKSIYKDLRIYFGWLMKMPGNREGKISELLVISYQEYINSIHDGEILGSRQFKNRCNPEDL